MRMLHAMTLGMLFCCEVVFGDQAIEPLARWAGKVRDESLAKAHPPGGVIADASAWERLWNAWRAGKEFPRVDFAEELILVGTVGGPNWVEMQVTLRDAGDLRFSVTGTETTGPGFGYLLLKIPRKGIKSVSGLPIAAAATLASDQPAVGHEEKLGVIPPRVGLPIGAFDREFGPHYGVVEKTAAGQRVWFDGEVGPVFDEIGSTEVYDVGQLPEVAIGPDGTLAYAARSGDSWRLIWGDKRSREWEWAGHPVLSRDGQHVAYEVKDGDKRRVVLDERPGPACERVMHIRFSPDGRRLAYAARRDGKWPRGQILRRARRPSAPRWQVASDPRRLARGRRVRRGGLRWSLIPR